MSLTSYPGRIQVVHRVIESIFAQTQKADEIILWLSADEFAQRELDLPEKLLRLIGESGFHIAWVQGNLRSHKKYFYVLQNNRENIIITVDDDVYYSATMIETLMNSYWQHPAAISARNVHLVFRDGNRIANYINWIGDTKDYLGMERMDLCAIGVGGILYPPNCGNERWFDEKRIRSCAENQDDLWLKYNEIIDGIPIVYAGMDGQDIAIEQTQENALYVHNTYSGRNDVCISRLFGIMQKCYPDIYQQWFGSIIQMKDYLQDKKEYYCEQIERMIEDSEKKDIYICGAGKYACALMEFIRICGRGNCIKAFLVSEDFKNQTVIDDVQVKQIVDLDREIPFSVVCGVGKKNRKELKKLFKAYPFCQWIDLDIAGIFKWMQLEKNTRIVSEENSKT